MPPAETPTGPDQRARDLRERDQLLSDLATLLALTDEVRRRVVSLQDRIKRYDAHYAGLHDRSLAVADRS